MDQMPECRRAFPRLAVNCEVAWRPCGDEAPRIAVARNISGGGMFLLAGEAPDPGDRMEVTVDPGMLSIPALNATVEVVRVERGQWNGFGTGDRSGPCYFIGARIVSMS